jgi:transcriptional regulator with XRE-family HTH domain/Zn-dependent peptidase ImmA (M78 family)
MAIGKREFGEFVRKARVDRGLALREAARRMDYSASYLSRVESGDETASPKLIATMSSEYGVPIEKLTELAPNKRPGVHGHMLQGSPELRALYRLGSILDAGEVDDVLRKLLADKLNLEGEELEKQLRDLKNELPRLRTGGEGLFAADVQPRVLSRKRISEMAEAFLRRHGLTRETYRPPTPIERLVELEPDIRLRVRELDRKQSEKPFVLGLSRWGSDGNKEIVLNSRLVESEAETSEYRLLFTLGHELFHALDHLPLMNSAARLRTECCRAVIDTVRANTHGKSAAQRAVESWQRTESPARRLSTAEDWREWQAQTFSAEVLMPQWAIEKEFTDRSGTAALRSNDKVNPKELAFSVAGETVFGSRIFEKSLNQMFKVSAQAMAIRLLALKLVL